MFYVHVAAVQLPGRAGEEAAEGEADEVYHKVATPQNMTATATVAKASIVAQQNRMAVKKDSQQFNQTGNCSTSKYPGHCNSLMWKFKEDLKKGN